MDEKHNIPPHKRSNHRRGFTLVELAILVALLCIIAATAVPRIAPESTNRNHAAGMQALGAIKSAWSVAFAEKRASPGYAEIASAVRGFNCTYRSGIGITCTGINDSRGNPVRFGVTDKTGHTVVINKPDLLAILKPRTTEK